MHNGAIIVAVVLAFVLALGGCRHSASGLWESAIHAEARGEKATALKLYSEAARAGSVSAQFRLGWKYATGEDVVRDDASALEWYLNAASSGHGTATNNIGAMINSGRGVPREPARALAWFLRGSALSDAKAMENIAWYYRTGTLVSRDAAKEYFWSALSVRHGDTIAADNLQKLAQSLPSDTRRQVDEAVRNYRFDYFLENTSDLRMAADRRDFVANPGAPWNPATSVIQFRFPAKIA